MKKYTKTNKLQNVDKNKQTSIFISIQNEK